MNFYSRVGLYLLIFVSTWARADIAQSADASTPPLIMSYWSDSGPPFIYLENGQVTGGIVWAIGNELGKTMGVKIEYRLLPTKRVELGLLDGGVHVACMSNPQWFEHDAKRFEWSSPLFVTTDNFIVIKGKQDSISKWQDLDGKRLGVYVNYVYHQQIMDRFKARRSLPVTVRGLETGLKMLEAGRIDALIEFGMIANHYINTHNLKSRYELARQPADRYELSCALSKMSPHDNEAIKKAIDLMITNQQIQRILQFYKVL